MISFAVTAKLICVFDFTFAHCWFSHALAQMYVIVMCFLPTADPDLFVPMGKSKRGDWLAEHKESGQTFRQYSHSGTRNTYFDMYQSIKTVSRLFNKGNSFIHFNIFSIICHI